jgi:nitroimidazol reductase NimA-like FMN-containing flavoprotein (pyridoxamine 5'-phosphate oxidase superfamily)
MSTVPKKNQRPSKPKAARPDVPGYGISENPKDLLPWKWAEGLLSKTQNYFLTTVRKDGRPHVMPIWGVWFDSAFYFSTGKNSVKTQNLEANPNCVLCPGGADEAVIVEGVAKKLADKKKLAKFARIYFDKYKWDILKMGEPVFVIRPKTVFGQIEETFTKTATRWTFS